MTLRIPVPGDETQPIEDFYPDSQQVDKQYRNKIVVTTVFKLSNEATDFIQKQYHIPIKIFPSAIYSEERKQFLEKQQRQVLHHIPLRFYDKNLTDYVNQRKFELKNLDFNSWVGQNIQTQTFVKFNSAESVGCPHYIVGCQLKCVLCKKFYTCRICHDEEADHEFPRFQTTTVKCMRCSEVQLFGNLKCTKCNYMFGTYKCDQCKFICGMGEDAKPTRHCEKCGVCIVGVDEFSKHCDKCCRCINKNNFESHKCVEKTGSCPVCMEPLQKSILQTVQLPCNHLLHQHCLDGMTTQGVYACPLCKKYMLVGEQKQLLTKHMLKMLRATFLLPYMEEVADKYQCNDCQRTLYMYAGLNCYCPYCDVFNSEVVEQNVSRKLLFDFLAEQGGKLTIPRRATVGNLKEFLLEVSQYTDMDDVKHDLKADFQTEEEAQNFCALLNEYPCLTWADVRQRVDSLDAVLRK